MQSQTPWDTQNKRLIKHKGIVALHPSILAGLIEFDMISWFNCRSFDRGNSLNVVAWCYWHFPDFPEQEYQMEILVDCALRVRRRCE